MMEQALVTVRGLSRLSAAVWLTGPGGDTVFANPAFEALLGAAPGSLVGRQRAEVIVSRRGPVADLLGPGGQRSVWLVDLAVPGGGLLSVAVVDGDRDRARASEEALAVVFHELRTPLATILFQVRELGRSSGAGGGAAVAVALGIVERQVGRLRRLIDDLGAASRLEAPSTWRGPAPTTDIAASAQEIVGALEAEASAEGASVEVDAPAPVMGRWYPEDVECIVGNLVLNAVCHAGGGRVLVTVRGDGHNGAVLSVRDWGVGVTPADHARIFEPFARGSKARRGGLGLACGSCDAQPGAEVRCASRASPGGARPSVCGCRGRGRRAQGEEQVAGFEGLGQDVHDADCRCDLWQAPGHHAGHQDDAHGWICRAGVFDDLAAVALAQVEVDDGEAEPLVLERRDGVVHPSCSLHSESCLSEALREARGEVVVVLDQEHPLALRGRPLRRRDRNAMEFATEHRPTSLHESGPHGQAEPRARGVAQRAIDEALGGSGVVVMDRFLGGPGGWGWRQDFDVVGRRGSLRQHERELPHDVLARSVLLGAARWSCTPRPGRAR
jgi:signal transduction histidine kinase